MVLVAATFSLRMQRRGGATLMIGYRFWKCIRWNSTRNGIRKSRLDVLWILVESGALYSVTMIFLLGFSETNTGAIFAASLGQISVRCPSPRMFYLRWLVILYGILMY